MGPHPLISVYISWFVSALYLIMRPGLAHKQSIWWLRDVQDDVLFHMGTHEGSAATLPSHISSRRSLFYGIKVSSRNVEYFTSPFFSQTIMLDHIINSIKLTFFTAVPGTTDLSGSAKENIKNSFYPAITGFRQTVNSYLHQSIFGLQATYEFDVNLSLIRTHCYPDNHNIGTLALEYVEGFVHELGKYTDVVSSFHS